jgi:hypothetical protein
MLSHIQPSALIGRVADYAGHALKLRAFSRYSSSLFMRASLSPIRSSFVRSLPRGCWFRALFQNLIAVGLLGC